MLCHCVWGWRLWLIFTWDFYMSSEVSIMKFVYWRIQQSQSKIASRCHRMRWNQDVRCAYLWTETGTPHNASSFIVMVGYICFAGPLPVVISSDSFVAVAAGATHTCAAWSRSFSCWGNNTYGQLGTGDTIARLTPTATNIGAGDEMSAAAPTPPLHSTPHGKF